MASSTPPGTLYGHQGELPSLPVPELSQTIAKLLASVRPHVSPEEFEHTEAVCREFESGTGKHLQELLEERASESRNWVRGSAAARWIAIVPQNECFAA
jgi:hypothetical protein